MTARILLGTASWTDKSLIESGRFYPPEATSAEARLRYYTTQFPLVEVDSSYCGLPTEKNSRLWVERTPEGFTFDVKAYSLFTEHPTPVRRLPKEIQSALPKSLRVRNQFYRRDAPDDVVNLCWSTFIDALLPLHNAGRLGLIVFQLPKWVFPNQQTKAYLHEVAERLGPYRAAVEFRNDIWMNPENREETLALLGDQSMTYICVDEPQSFSSSVPPVVAATTRTGFVRFHGRNAETWEKRTKTSAERFDWYYSPDELEDWVPRIAELASQTDRVHVVMNTNNYDQGPSNLRLLREQLEAAGLAVAPVPA